jgi:hypothetical protein
MLKSKTMNISIKSDPKKVYDFVSNLENLPRWASSTFPSIKEVDGEWVTLQMDRIRLCLQKEITLES